MMTNPILDKITKLNAEIEQLRAEVLEQARLLGMSGEREAKLLAEIERLRARVEVLARACRLIQIDPSTKHECRGCYLQSRLACFALEEAAQ